eukprot:6183138-Pleurochrysis_carterae.AAC.9
MTPSSVCSAVTTHGSESHCVNPNSRSQGKSERCQRRPACAMPKIYGLFDAADTRTPVRSVSGVLRRSVAVDDLALLQLALQVSRDKIPSPHQHADGRSERREDAQGCRPHRGAEHLVVVNALHLRAPLHAQPRFKSSATLALVGPDEPDKRAPWRDLRAVNHRPAAIGPMVGDFCPLGGSPALGIVG